MPAQLAPERRRTTTRDMIVAVDDPCTSPELCATVRAHAGAGELAILVVAPAHGSAATQWYVDEDAARADATQRLRTCVACLRGDGIDAHAQLGDADPVQAIRDALHDFDADEILMVTAPQRPSRWLRPNVIDRARSTLDLPVTHVVMPPKPVETRPDTTAERGSA